MVLPASGWYLHQPCSCWLVTTSDQLPKTELFMPEKKISPWKIPNENNIEKKKKDAYRGPQLFLLSHQFLIMECWGGGH